MAASLAADGIDSRWEPEVKRAKQGGRRLVDELTEEQVRERIGRERKALHEAAVYRAKRLARLAFGIGNGYDGHS